MPPSTVYFITGANRGIGLALVGELVARQLDVTIFAGVRDVVAAHALRTIAEKHTGKVFIVKFVSGDVASNEAIAKEIQRKFGYVDVVIPCAAIGNYLGTTLETPPETMTEFLQANVIGVLVLFQAMHHLLKASKSSPKFVPLSSPVASLTAYISIPAGYTCYGVSKAAVNYIARRIHYENEWLICFPLSPGIVATDMASSNRTMDKTGTLAPIQDAMQISPEEAARALINIIEGSTREKDGGEFINVDGSKIPW
ncbi:hypothetical protein BDQ12DRAFT_724461 [Crucibulum laeve]|uniref:NAD(P)-binding protein n=1 Tax=Crucibulum laeve TaxID=68775 RepID=A0A5C3LYQ3_9AGAR|nr:hypothetical protein BDQ12DRAFT_724461 [Crucibulum laeve]